MAFKDIFWPDFYMAFKDSRQLFTICSRRGMCFSGTAGGSAPRQFFEWSSMHCHSIKDEYHLVSSAIGRERSPPCSCGRWPKLEYASYCLCWSCAGQIASWWACHRLGLQPHHQKTICRFNCYLLVCHVMPYANAVPLLSCPIQAGLVVFDMVKYTKESSLAW